MPDRDVTFANGFNDEAPATIDFIKLHNEEVLASYGKQRSLIEEHYNQEVATTEGAYGKRQIFELVQNAADAARGYTEGTISVILTREALYCANSGSPITVGGVRAIMQSFLSRKTGSEIGRYGLGFKSVLGATNTPEFYSQLVSFRFDPVWNEEQIGKVVSHPGKAPTLRLARPIDNEGSALTDSIVSELLCWATSVVKLPLKDRANGWLEEDIENFPKEFLLFCPHISKLTLENRTEQFAPYGRVITRSGSDPTTIYDNEIASEWHVFSTTVEPTAAAKSDGGHFAGRARVTLSWAVPAQGGSSIGKFWAYFPLVAENMSLKGIMNAAWKLNDDRQNILKGAFNEELGRVGVELALSNLNVLLDKDDPGKLLEILPGRLDERFGHDWYTTMTLYRIACDFPVIPDTSSILRKPGDLKLPPSKLPEEAAQLWGLCPVMPSDWAHPSTAKTTTRSARLDQLLGAGQRQTVRAWLEALVDYETISAVAKKEGTNELAAKTACSASAMRTALSILCNAQTTAQIKSEVLEAKILLLTDESFAAPQKNSVFLPPPGGSIASGVRQVHPELVNSLGLENVFSSFEISEVDAASELQAVLGEKDFLDQFSDSEWTHIWDLIAKTEASEMGEGRAAALLRDFCGDQNPLRLIKAKTRDGRFNSLWKCLLLGGAIDEGTESDSKVLIDNLFQVVHEQTLLSLGAVSAPKAGGGSHEEPWFDSYRRYAIEEFMAAKPKASPKPTERLLSFWEERFTGPIEPIKNLSENGKASFTVALMNHPDFDKHWHLRHPNSGTYPSVKVMSPSCWAVHEYGRFRTSKGIKKLRDVVGTGLLQWKKFLPVADLAESDQRRLGLPQSVSELTSSLMQHAINSVVECNNRFLVGSLYAVLSSSHPAPPLLWCSSGSLNEWFAPDEITVVVANGANDPVIRAITEVNRPFVLVSSLSDAESLVNSWGLKPTEKVVTLETRAVPSGPETPLADVFAGIGHRLKADQELRLVPCSSLNQLIVTENGAESKPKPFIREGDVAFFSDEMPSEELLDHLNDELCLNLSQYEIDDVLSYQRSEATRQRLVEIQRTIDLTDKLLLCVEANALRRWLSRSLLSAAEQRHGELTDKRVAEIFLSVYGVESLIRLKEDLAAAGFEVPSKWAGSYRANRFVSELGFPREFAGFERSDREAAIDVPGPSGLPPLHNFQELAASRIRTLLMQTEARKRGLLCLPTGAGKTRVAVEAFVRAMRENGFLGPVLWIAQSDELCEQAVQSWSEVWRALGPKGNLRINRLWAANDAEEWGEGYQIVIATIQKLNNVVNSADYDWMKDCSAVVIDEAHLSTTPEYTSLLNWLGARRDYERCPIVGLTATPFRGNESETTRLVYRYANNRLDEGIFNNEEPYEALQRLGVLAHVNHLLIGGVEVSLSDQELRDLERTRLFPPGAGERLGTDRVRNEIIIEAIKELPMDWTILLFTPSVESANIISAMLNAVGVPSAPISANTDQGARRHYIEQFRIGKIRVLANYGVLTTGFDAPAVRAIVVARPTFSPVLYQQMIGRGLRGPLNGGKQTCQIINVIDTFARFGEELAFTQFEYLWANQNTLSA